MANLPSVTLEKIQYLIGKRNDKGQLCNIYTPLQNFVDENSKSLGDFTTEKLNFDMEHPVDIIVQDAYDGAVNLVLNDGKNKPRLVNTRFAVQDEGTFKITDHIGFKDSNVYDGTTFDVDTLLKQVPIKIPQIEYLGLGDNEGKMPVGVYTFYFKLVDVDGNESEVVAESGIVQCHIGQVNTPKQIRLGLQDEDSAKSIKFKLTNLDPGFTKIRVLFERRSSSADQAVTATYHKIIFDYPINNKGECEINITGSEQILGTSKEEVYVDYADINSVGTQTVANNILLFGNTSQTEHDWEAIKRMSWKIIPSWGLSEKGSVGALNHDYKDNLTNDSEKNEKGFIYYNTKNVYYRVGYWPGEIYRFGIVYIFEDNSLSPVIDLQGIDFNTVNTEEGRLATWVSDSEKGHQTPSEYAKLFFTQDERSNSETDVNTWLYPCHLYDTPDGYFNKKHYLNSRGVIRFPYKNLYDKGDDGSKGSVDVIPTPMYIKFDMSLIGYERAQVTSEDVDKQGRLDPENFKPWDQALKEHHIKGFFFVRQKRVPLTLAQGVVIGLTHKDAGSLPILKSIDNKYIGQSFLGADRLLHSDGTTWKIPRNKTENYRDQAMLVPDAEMHQATYNQLFTSADFCLQKAAKYTFNCNNKLTHHFCSDLMPELDESDTVYRTKLTNVPDGTTLLTNGEDFFSTKAGSAEEAFKTEDLVLPFNMTPPQDLTTSVSVVRGMWGHYVGMSNPNREPGSTNDIPPVSPFEYGEVYNICTDACMNMDNAVNMAFNTAMNAVSPYFAVSHRSENKTEEICFRGDCFISMFTHRMNRNFIDPELPTNTKIVNPDCWAQNYAVRCTAQILGAAHSNLTKDNDGWYIGPTSAYQRKKALKQQALMYFLTGNFIGAIMALTKADKDDGVNPDELGLGDSYINPTKVVQQSTTTYWAGGKDITKEVSKNDIYYLLDKVEPDGESNYKVFLETDKHGNPIEFDADDNSQVYKNGYANEICPAFEIYVGPSKRKAGVSGSSTKPNTDLSIASLKFDAQPARKKVNPKEQEQNASGFNLKALFKCDDNWELHGTASINRADVNAVGLGQWITFPILSSTNLQMRDVDFSNATEEAKFNRKRSFYPLQALDQHNPLADSVIINGAAHCSMPAKGYHHLPNTPFFKQEFFTRIYNSYRDTSNSITNQFRLILQNAYQDYTKQHGRITKLIAKGNYVYVIFAHGIGILDMSAIQGQSALDFLPPINIISADIGSIWKDSVIETDQGIFGVDSVAKKIWQIQGVQLTTISDMKVQKFLNDNLDMSEFVFRPYVGHINIKTHYNKFKEDVMFTYYNDLLWKVPAAYRADKYSVNAEGFIIEKLKDGKTKRVEKNGDLVKADEQLLPNWDKQNEKWKSYSDLINELDGNSCHKWSKGLEWSLCYNLRLGQFITFYDWIPLESENIDNIYFSFDREGIDYLSQPIYKSITPKLIGQKVDTFSGNIGLPVNKMSVDSAFTDIVKMYTIKDEYECKVSCNVGNFDKSFACYLRNTADQDITITIRLLVNGNQHQESQLVIKDTDPVLFIYPKIEDLPENSECCIQFESGNTYLLYDPKTVDLEYNYHLNSKCPYFSDKVKNLRMDLYEFRDSNNSLPLWKHGQAGVYDNQGEIKPTNWYGKQHEFNFEFVVNESPQVQKIFNNLLLISNKTEPNKFEYEIVGQGYEWWPYKAVVFWANDKVKNGKFSTLDDAYKYILSNDVSTIRNNYPDFPETDLEYKAQKTNNPYKYKKLPYLAIELTDRQGRQDRSYNPYDKWSSVMDARDQLPRQFDYTFNTNETVIKYDKQLNEYRIHDEQLGNDMWKYGRIRGNMQYLEDLWRIEIRPLAFQWCYINNSNKLEKKKITETRHRDKYIKIKIRYSGEDLAVIQAIGTLLDESRA